jgi:hypothetical protein
LKTQAGFPIWGSPAFFIAMDGGKALFKNMRGKRLAAK